MSSNSAAIFLKDRTVATTSFSRWISDWFPLFCKISRLFRQTDSSVASEPYRLESDEEEDESSNSISIWMAPLGHAWAGWRGSASISSSISSSMSYSISASISSPIVSNLSLSAALASSWGVIPAICNLLTWVELRLVNKIFYIVWGEIQPLKTVDASRFGVIFENSQNCKRIIDMTLSRSMCSFHAPNSTQMPQYCRNQGTATLRIE